MRKNTLIRLLLGLAQHILAVCAMLTLATVLFNSYLTVQTMDGQTTYALSPLNAAPEFENSEPFRDIFQTAVKDITRLVVIKGQLETGGEFDPAKLIDVTEYASRKGLGNQCRVTAVYELEDLIKWGKYGLEYTNRAMSMSDFVNYFGTAVSPRNFRLNGDELEFVGFFDESFTPKIKRYYSKGAENNPESSEETEDLSKEELEAIEDSMKLYSEEQLEDMVFSYILSSVPDGLVDVSREDDGSVTVYFSMLQGRYETADREKQLTAYAGNWVDYMRLQSNVEEAVNGLSDSYVLYQNCADIYQENGNLKYTVRVVTEDGVVTTYTNQSELTDLEDYEITNFYSEYRRYFIYYPDSLEFLGNSSITEADIHDYLNRYDYAYPENTHIWIGVDTSYIVEGDAFYNANELYSRIVPNIRKIVALIIFCVGVWFLIAFYLTVTAGSYYDGEDRLIRYLNKFDRIWTELFAAFWVFAVFAAGYGQRYLAQIAENVYELHLLNTADRVQNWNAAYGWFALYGGAVSLTFCLLWYSLVRRIKSMNVWRDSFIHWLVETCRKGIQYILIHRNAAISTLLPYLSFVLINLVGVGCGVVCWRQNRLGTLAAVIFLILFDGIIGILMFRRNSEWTDLAEAITRIRDGEVTYKLDVERLHGNCREMGDAINHIGEGIHKAVNTSMKDEQMKTDLITNVSHDIKTPLTSIINYVDLLKRLKITEEPAKSYIDVLDSKSQRLKQLTDDLVEASKLSSGNIEFQMERLNFTELLNQVIGELSERMEEKKLQIVFDGGNKPAFIFADSRRMWRVMENLFNNVYKYAMENTRVYIDLEFEHQPDGNLVVVSIKNISDRQMNYKAADLTERFIRGDDSRTTEGSGLGLYITKNLVQAQKGEFDIQLDGDLFKAVMKFPENIQS